MSSPAHPTLGRDPRPAPARAWLDRLQRVETPGLTAIGDAFPIVWERAQGTQVWDVEGRSYLDLTAGFGVAAIGHAHPAVVAAVADQVARLPHAMADVHPARIKIELLERLAALAPGALRVTHLGLSGSDAVEAALKTACLATGRAGVLTFEGAYHGLSYGALALCGDPVFRRPFAQQLGEHVRQAPFVGPDAAEFGAIESFLAGGEIGAVIVEPIQGRGGVRPAPPGLLPALSTLCRRHGALLIVDEIFTGLGRTGRWFAVEGEAVTPDLLLAGKALGGGLPISAAIGTPAAMAAWGGRPGPALHTQTFLGHPLAAAAALAVLDVIEREGLVARAAALGERFLGDLGAQIGGLEGVTEVRGRGLLAGIVLTHPLTGAPDRARAEAVMKELCARGILVLTAGVQGEVIELSPPLVIGAAELERAIAELRTALLAVPPR
jgi:4-aminobutyrate aminotransferase/(S)-3-amino-2-methylpropionate transaminase